MRRRRPGHPGVKADRLTSSTRHIVLIECSAFFAAMNSKILTESRVLWREGRGIFQDLALLGDDPQLAPQPAQLLAPVAGQPLRLVLIDVDLARPVPERLWRAPSSRASCG